MTNNWNVRELKKELASRGLNTEGKREELLERLLRNMMDDHSSGEDNNESKGKGCKKFNFGSTRFSIRDVIEILPTFDPTDESGLTAEQWTHQVEELMKIYEIDASIIILASRNKMKAYAAKWYETMEKGVSWETFGEALRKNFKSRKSEAELHEILRKKIRNRDQGLIDYFFEMCAVAKKHVSEENVIYYIIQGINDYKISNVLKMTRIDSLEQLKQQIEWYLRMNQNEEREHKSINSDVSKNTKGELRSVNKELRCQCYNCHEKGHIASKCPRPLKKPVCGRCNKIGHNKEQCRVKIDTAEEKSKVYKVAMQTEVQEVTTSNDDKEIEVDQFGQIQASVEVNGKLVATTMLVDSGSSVSIVKEKIVKQSKYSVIQNKLLKVTGINDSILKMLGKFTTSVILGENIYKVELIVVDNETMDIDVLLGRDFLNMNHISTMKIIRVGTYNIDHMNQVYVGGDSLMLLDSGVELDIGDSEETMREKDRVLGLYEKYYRDGEIKTDRVRYEAEIKLKEKKVIRANPKRFSHWERNELRKITDELLRTGVIRTSESPYASRVVLVKKKNGSIRMCVDYRQLNKVVERICYPMPVIEDVLIRLSGKRYFTCIDLRNGFYHVDLTESSKRYTSFVTEEGQFEYNKLPFGYTNAPAHFVKYIQLVLKELIDGLKILVFIDDILIATEGIEEHLLILKELFSVLAGNSIKLQITKCRFLKNEIEYLGYNVKGSQITLSEGHVETIKTYPVPTDSKSLQRFIGMTSYFRKFIQGYSRVAAPLYDLLKSQVFEFCDEHWEAFSRLKELLISRPVLGIYNVSNETQLHTDASASGYGAVLMQKQKEDGEFHPIMFFSRRTTNAETRLHSFELETLAVVYAVKRFRPYLFGVHFTLVTDCNALRLTLAKRDLNAKIDRWGLFLEEYDFEVVHRKGDRMRHVDAISRIKVYHLEMNEKDLFVEKMYVCQLEDEDIRNIKLRIGDGRLKGYELREGIVYRKDKERLQLVVPERMIGSVIWKYHDKMGHLGVEKVGELIRRQFYFSKMRERLKAHIEECMVCVAYNPKPIRKEVLLQSIDKGKGPFQTIHIDHLGPLDTTKGKNVYLLVVVDAFTKYIRMYPTKTTNSDEVCKHLKSYFENYSIPDRVISDRGTAYTSRKFERFIQEYSIVHVKIATASPNSNGQVERYNRVVVPIIAKMVNEKGKEWDRLIQDVEYLMNNTLNKSVNEIPAKLLFGVIQKGKGFSTIEIEQEEQEDVRDLSKIREQAEGVMKKQQDYNKKYYDKGVKKEVRYKEGELVVIRDHPQIGVNNKLKRKFKGPYRVDKVLDRDRYVLKDIEGYQVTGRPFEGIFDARNMKIYSRKVEGKGISTESETEDSDMEEVEYLDPEYEVEYVNSD